MNTAMDVLWLAHDELLYRLPQTGLDQNTADTLLLYQRAPALSLPRWLGADTTIHPLQRRFEIQAQINPGAIAVKSAGASLTYGELDAQADGLASLLQQHGYGPGQVCAIRMAPSIAMARAVLAALKGGGAYLVLDPARSAGLHRAQMEAAQARILVLGQGSPPPRIPTLLCGDDDGSSLPYAWPQEYPGGALAPAYVPAAELFGEGRPRRATHQDVIGRLRSMQQLSPIGQGDCVLQNSHAGRDSHAWEMLWPLSYGARLLIPAMPGKRDAHGLRELIASERITVMHAAPSLLRLLPAETGGPQLRSLRALFCGGATETALSAD